MRMAAEAGHRTVGGRSPAGGDNGPQGNNSGDGSVRNRGKRLVDNRRSELIRERQRKEKEVLEIQSMRAEDL